jgi:lipoprotein-anchoring transpeptidase ErfK/SrfK
MRSIWPVLSFAFLAGCDQEVHGETRVEPAAPTESAPEPVVATPAEPAPDPGPPKRLFTKRFVVNVRSEPDAEALRIGYLRAGAVLQAKTAEPVGRTGCPRGWYELTTGGFVCNGREVTAFLGDRLPESRATQPDRAARLPYRYGFARRDRTPVYRRMPTDEEAAQYEGYVIPGDEVVEGEDPASVPAGIGGSETVPEAAPDPTAIPTPEPGQNVLPQPAPPAENPGPEAEAAEEEAEEEPGLPTLESLQGENEGVLERWMMSGFYVSLDREFRTGARRYWRTQQNGYIPFQWLGLRGGSEFHGVQITEEAPLPIAFVMARNTPVVELVDENRTRRAGAWEYHRAFRVTGTTEVRGVEYLVSAEGPLVRRADATVIEPGTRPEGIAPEEKWIDVDLTHQTLVLYEGDRPVYATLISSGIIRREDVDELDHETPTGIFRIRSKHVATAMDGDNAFDGPYSIEDVPYVMYYESGYAIHSAFWHDLFGRPKSHGCVNAAPEDARVIFDWTDPQVPAGWHGAYPAEPGHGTAIYIHGETPRRRR